MAHGGKRPGAGRKKGSGRFGEATRVLRVPTSLVPQVQQLMARAALQTTSLTLSETAARVYPNNAKGVVGGPAGASYFASPEQSPGSLLGLAADAAGTLVPQPAKGVVGGPAFTTPPSAQQALASPEQSNITPLFQPAAHHPRARQEFTLFESRVAAGFPSPADDGAQKGIDLNEHLVANPTATYFVRAEGESMLLAGIHPGDLLVVDRSVKATHGKIVIAAVNGELTVKRLHHKNNEVILLPENPAYRPIPITADTSFSIWGVVTNVVHHLS